MKLHLGCGEFIKDGWINLDATNYPGVIVTDLRKPLPYKNESIDFVFSEHFFEHLKKEEGIKLLKEIHRVLKPGGVSRTTVPSLETLIKCYNENNFPEVDWAKSKCDFINNGMRYWGHEYMYDIDELINVHHLSGFLNIEKCEHRKSKYEELNMIEIRGWTSEIIIEAKK